MRILRFTMPLHLGGVRPRLALVVLLATLPMFVFALHSASEDRAREQARAITDAVRLARVVGLEEKRLFGQVRMLLIDLAGRVATTAGLTSECHGGLDRTRGAFKWFDNLAVIRPDGTAVCSADPLTGDVAGREYFVRALETRGFAFGGYERDAVTDRAILNFAYPVLDAEGRPALVVSATMDLRRLSDFEDSIKTLLPPASTVMKMDGDARILAMAPYVAERVGTRPWGIDALRPLLARGSGSAVMRDSSGRDVLRAVARAPYSLYGGDVFVVLDMPGEVAFADVDAALRESLFALTGLVVLVLGATWLLATVIISRPVRDLTRATERVAAGELDARLGPPYPAGELGDLARRFDVMASTVRAREGDLVRSEARLRSFVDRAPYGIFATDAGGRLMTANPAFARLLGRSSPDDLTGVALEDLCDPTSRGEPLRSAVQAGLEARGLEARLVRRDGSTALVRGAVTMAAAAEDRTVAREVIVEDITEQRAVEDQFRQAQKLEAVGRLAGGVAHDFNNCLTVILGYADLVRESLAGQARADVETISEAALRARNLTQQLLAFSRRQVLDVGPVNLNGVLESLQKMLRRLIGEDVELATVLQPELGLIRADRGQIEQIVMNLAVNARDAMPRGGTLTIETRNELVAPDSRPAAVDLAPGSYVVLVVADTGVGMDDATASRAFEPFFTTKDAGRGTGLGLSTVYGIVKQSGGQISVSTQVGRGTTFVMWFPRLEGEIERPDTDLADGTVEGRGESILLVEDEAAVTDVTVRILAGHHYRVVQARTAEDAMRLADEAGSPFDMLLTDVVLPGMTGVELAARLTRSHAGMKVLYMSGHLPESLAPLPSSGVAVGYLRKPFTAQGLLHRIHQILHGDQGA